jgi:hypothetical protein
MRARAAWSAGAVLLAASTVLLAGVRPAAASGSVALFDDDGGAALFTGALLAPGRTQTGCVSVDASGADPADSVVLAADSLSGTLVPYLSVTVDVGSGGHMGDCSGFVTDPLVSPWSGRLSALTTGIPTGWQPGQSSTRTFRFTVAVDDDQTAAGLAGSGRFVWQLTTTPPPPPPPSPSPSASPSPSPSASPSPSRSPSPTTQPTPDPTPTGAPTSEPTVGPTGRPEPPPAPQPTSSSVAPVPVPPAPPVDGPPWPTPTASASPTRRPTPAPSGSPATHLGGGENGGAGSGPRASRRADVVLGVPLPALRETARRLGDAALHIAQEPQYPLGVAALVGIFLLVQDLIDRRDPKLAAARVTSRDESLLFPDLFPPGGRT